MKLLGLRSVIYPTKNIEADTEWWTRAIGIDPYFVESFYVGFNIGGYELGLWPAAAYDEGPVTYWGVKSVEAAVDHFKQQNCHVHSAPRDVGDGIVMAVVKKPGGQLIGLIYNPHFKAAS